MSKRKPVLNVPDFAAIINTLHQFFPLFHPNNFESVLIKVQSIVLNCKALMR